VRVFLREEDIKNNRSY